MEAAGAQPDMPIVRWTFGRDGEHLTIERSDDHTLVVTRDGAPCTYSFDGAERLASFQADMEEMLIHTGWRLEEFWPERRRGGDRRHFPRLTERRRWWTDPSSLWAIVRRGGNREP